MMHLSAFVSHLKICFKIGHPKDVNLNVLPTDKLSKICVIRENSSVQVLLEVFDFLFYMEFSVTC